MRLSASDVLTLAGHVHDRLSGDTKVLRAVAPDLPDEATARAARRILRLLSLADEQAMQSPYAVAVLPAAEQPAGTGEDGPGQPLSRTVRVLCIVRTTNAGDAGDALGSLRAVTRAALAGWVPPGAGVPLRFAGGRLAEISELRQGRAWWADDYAVPVWLAHDGEEA